MRNNKMAYKTFKYQDDAQEYLQAQVDKYVMERYNLIVTKEHFHEMFVIGDIGFSFSVYSTNAMESFLGFKATRVHYIKDDDAYYIDYQVNGIDERLECGYFRGWDDAFYKEVFAYVDKVIAKANELPPKSYSYASNPVYKVVKGN